jgi:hypothetical protein
LPARAPAGRRSNGHRQFALVLANQQDGQPIVLDAVDYRLFFHGLHLE